MKNSLGISVPKQIAEEVLGILRKMQLVDNRLEFSRTEEHIAIPLSRMPSVEEASTLRSNWNGLEIQQTDFALRSTKPRSLKEAVSDQIPNDLISHLPSSFDIIGDIAVLEMPEQVNQYAATIGNGILKINPHLRLVLKRSSKTSGQFRTRKLEVLAGLGTTQTLYKEFTCSYTLDVSTVYFSPRLSHERNRVATQVKEGERVVDIFAGVGPYSVLIAKLQPKARVYSIDLNPQAFNYLRENILLNQVADRVTAILGDAREVVRRNFRGRANRIVMNLPSEAKKFLDVAALALKPEGGTIHYYAFATREESLDSITRDVGLWIEHTNRKVQAVPYAKVIKEVGPSRVQVAVDLIVK